MRSVGVPLLAEATLPMLAGCFLYQIQQQRHKDDLEHPLAGGSIDGQCHTASGRWFDKRAGGSRLVTRLQVNSQVDPSSRKRRTRSRKRRHR